MNRQHQEEIALFAAHLQDRELAQNTIKIYVASMRIFFQRYPEATKRNGVKWKDELLRAGCKPRTVNVRLNAFNAYCAMQGGERVKTIRIHNATAVSNVISKEEYRRLLTNLEQDEDWKWYYGIRLLASTGARVSELIQLTKADLDRGYAELWTKGKIRRIYIPKSFQRDAAGHYRSLGAREYLLQSKYGKQMTARGVSQMLQNFATKYGIDKKVMHPHSFRHLFALEFLRRNGNLSLLADLMGHSSVATTAIYTRLTKEQQKAAADKTIDW